MKMITDAHFVIGGLHIRQNMPCQDHTRCGGTEDAAYISLSDGCSTGGETDTGARILNSAAAIVLQDYLNAGVIIPDDSPRIFGEKIRTIALSVARTMSLKAKDMSATLLYALLTPQGGFVHVFGDGCVILCYNDGTTVVYQYVWKQNTPYYLFYTGIVLQDFIRTHDDNGQDSLTVTKTVITTDGSHTTSEEYFTAAEGCNGYAIPLLPSDAENLRCIVLCSDGIESFKISNTIAVSALEITAEIISFKQWQGEFVKRRLSRMLHDLSKKDIVPMDDMAIAAIHVTTQNTENHGTDNNRSAPESTASNT